MDTYRKTMILLMLSSLFQIVTTTFSLIEMEENDLIERVSDTGLLIQSLSIFLITLFEWSFSDSIWFHRMYKVSIFAAVLGFAMFTSIFIKQGLFSLDSVNLLLSITTTLTLIQKYNVLYK
ncbi:hypothetical protein P9761_14385 [Brevibacillus centrosporus]|uniref:hypothetical protein n=1 Tax=Brevibacillus centrosporus TaxID=54910 RepID=UPI002E2500DF|nr:hypothetical protein [Brevibacillus centrosporus]